MFIKSYIAIATGVTLLAFSLYFVRFSLQHLRLFFTFSAIYLGFTLFYKIQFIFPYFLETLSNSVFFICGLAIALCLSVFAFWDYILGYLQAGINFGFAFLLFIEISQCIINPSKIQDIPIWQEITELFLQIVGQAGAFFWMKFFSVQRVVYISIQASFFVIDSIWITFISCMLVFVGLDNFDNVWWVRYAFLGMWVLYLTLFAVCWFVNRKCCKEVTIGYTKGRETVQKIFNYKGENSIETEISVNTC